MTGKVLLIVLDQFRADCVATSVHNESSGEATLESSPLHDAVTLPNLQSLMQESMTFTQHYTVTTPCGPSRASLLTGLYAMNHRSVRNGTPLGSHHQTLGQHLRCLGVEPMLFGYTDASADPVGRHPDDPDLKDYEGVANGFNEMVRMRLESAGPWVGYLKARGVDVPSNYWDLYKPELDRSTASADYPDGSPVRSPARYAAEDSDTAFLTNRTLETLAAYESSSWFSLLTYIRPHPPLVAPAPFNCAVALETLPKPAGRCSVDQLCQSHPFFKSYFSEPANKGLFIGFDGHCEKLTDHQIAELRAVYLGLALEVDQHIGRIISYLRESGQYDDTLIVVTADHGEMLGDQHLWGKSFPFDAALRVPLIIRDPRSPQSHGTRTEAFTESVDIAPTLIEWCGGDVLPALNGRSLMPYLDGKKPEHWRQYVFSEAELGEPDIPTRFQQMHNLPSEQANYAVLRTKQYKYVHFNGGLPPMLFDLVTDPDETLNLANDDGYQSIVMTLSAQMLNHRMSHAEHSRTGMKLTERGLFTSTLVYKFP